MSRETFGLVFWGLMGGVIFATIIFAVASARMRCRHCGKPLHHSAPSCLQCGAPNPPRAEKPVAGPITKTILSVAVFGFAAWVAWEIFFG